MTTSAEVPGRYDVAISGRGFMLDEQGDQPALVRQSLRTQSEQHTGAAANIGEATVNPEGFWRRSRDGWHHGAGQTYADRDESDSLRFRTSQGVDVFSTKHQATLLHTTALAYTFGDARGEILLAGSRVYVNDVTALKFVTSPLTVPWTTTTVTGTVATMTGPRALATDGSTVYIACQANGIYTTSTSGSTASSFITGSVAHVFFVKGRLLATYANSLYNPVTAGALPASLLDLPSDWVWVDAANGPNHIYLLATNGSVTTVYKTAIKPDGTALDIPTVAGEVNGVSHGIALYGYAGFLFLVTQTGVRMAEIDSNGNLVFGSEIPTGAGYGGYGACVGDDRFVWAPYHTSDGDGLLRLDLSSDILPVTPAYAPDVREPAATGQTRDVSSIIRYSGRMIFVVQNVLTSTHAYVESTSYLTSGYIDSGLVALDLADPKTPVAVDVEGGALSATETITEAISVDRGSTFTSVATWDSQADGEQSVTGVAASRQFELRTTLASNGTTTPVLYRHTLKVEPAVNQGDYVVMRLRLFEDELDNTGSASSRTPSSDITFLRGLQEARTVVDVQVGSESFTGTVRDLDLTYVSRTASADDGSWNTVATVRVKQVV